MKIFQRATEQIGKRLLPGSGVYCTASTAVVAVTNYTRRQINQDRMIFGDFSVNSKTIFFKFCKKNFKEIGSKLTEKSPKIMRSWLINFKLTASSLLYSVTLFWILDHNDNKCIINSERTRKLGPEGPQLAGASSYSNGCQQRKAKNLMFTVLD